MRPLTVLFFSLVFMPMSISAQVNQESWQKLIQMNEQFENYQKDFVQFGQSKHARHSRNTEDLTDVGLVMVADQTISYLESVETLVAVYLKVSNKKDRMAIWPLITEQMATAKKRLDRQIEVTNAEITTLKTPGVVAEATRMRDDLRRVAEYLEEAQKEIEAAEANLP